MLRGAVIGLGKMGISHAAIVGAHPDVEMVAVCDTSALVLSAFERYTKVRTYEDHEKLLGKETLDFIVVAVPTRFHFPIVKAALERGIHVFCEKPFTLKPWEGEELVQIAKSKGLVNQVGYHNHFLGTFRELKRLLQKGLLGDLFHFTAEAYGPVVVKEKGSTWRSKPTEGGGCLYDYACHVINLVQVVLGKPIRVNGTLLKSIYSQSVEDAAFSSLRLESGLSGTLMVNWSDETFRKMSTTLTIQGKKGKVVCDATELKVHLTTANPELGFESGWTIKYLTELTPPCDYYLRGEEYSEQIDHFVEKIRSRNTHGINTFEEALHTDKVIEMLLANAKQEA